MITIINCGLSNLHSITKALEFIGAQVCVSSKKEDIKNADKIVLPGVGTFSKGMENLKKLGLIEILEEEVIKMQKPFLGICLGMQLLAKKGTEFGECAGLGWLPGTVKLFDFKKGDFRVPHMGWDDVEIISDSSLFSALGKKSAFYFVHSYYLDCTDSHLITAYCDYGIKFPAAILKNNIFSVQFHPEKSQKTGLRLLKNFINWNP